MSATAATRRLKPSRTGSGTNMESYRDEILCWAAEQYGTEPERLWAAYPDYEVLRRADSGKWYALIADVPRAKLGLDGEGRVDILNVKCDSRMIGSLLSEPGFRPAYHMSRGNWVTILLDGTVKPEQIFPLLEMSYGLVAPKRRSPRKRGKAEWEDG